MLFWVERRISSRQRRSLRRGVLVSLALFAFAFGLVGVSSLPAVPPQETPAAADNPCGQGNDLTALCELIHFSSGHHATTTTAAPVDTSCPAGYYWEPEWQGCRASPSTTARPRTTQPPPTTTTTTTTTSPPRLVTQSSCPAGQARHSGGHGNGWSSSGCHRHPPPQERACGAAYYTHSGFAGYVTQIPPCPAEDPEASCTGVWLAAEKRCWVQPPCYGGQVWTPAGDPGGSCAAPPAKPSSCPAGQVAGHTHGGSVGVRDCHSHPQNKPCGESVYTHKGVSHIVRSSPPCAAPDDDRTPQQVCTAAGGEWIKGDCDNAKQNCYASGGIWSGHSASPPCYYDVDHPEPGVKPVSGTTSTVTFTEDVEHTVTFECYKPEGCLDKDTLVLHPVGTTITKTCTLTQGYWDKSGECFKKTDQCKKVAGCPLNKPSGGFDVKVQSRQPPPDEQLWLSLTVCNAWTTLNDNGETVYPPDAIIRGDGTAALTTGVNAGKTCPGYTPPPPPPPDRHPLRRTRTRAPNNPTPTPTPTPTLTTPTTTTPPVDGCPGGQHKDNGSGGCHSHRVPTACGTSYQTINSGGHGTATTAACPPEGLWLTTCLVPAPGEHGHVYWNPTDDPWPSDALPYGDHGCADHTPPECSDTEATDYLRSDSTVFSEYSWNTGDPRPAAMLARLRNGEIFFHATATVPRCPPPNTCPSNPADGHVLASPTDTRYEGHGCDDHPQPECKLGLSSWEITWLVHDDDSNDVYPGHGHKWVFDLSSSHRHSVDGKCHEPPECVDFGVWSEVSKTRTPQAGTQYKTGLPSGDIPDEIVLVLFEDDSHIWGRTPLAHLDDWPNSITSREDPNLLSPSFSPNEPNLKTVPRCGGIKVEPTSLKIKERETGTYTVRLESKPTADVTVTPVSSDPSKATVSGALTFTRFNWDRAQAVTVTGGARDPKDPAVTIWHETSSTDTSYGTPNDERAQPVTVTVLENDTPRECPTQRGEEEWLVETGKWKDLYSPSKNALTNDEPLGADVTVTMKLVPNLPHEWGARTKDENETKPDIEILIVSDAGNPNDRIDLATMKRHEPAPETTVPLTFDVSAGQTVWMKAFDDEDSWGESYIVSADCSQKVNIQDNDPIVS